jgi:methylated-DNA-protein-cysteine methyltransferase-like protein
MPRTDQKFRQRACAVVAAIPSGRVMSYGQIAAVCGAAWAAWEVGQIAHYGDSDLPWQRVVSKNGGLASGYPGGKDGHRRALEAEGVKISEDYRVDIEQLRWHPAL